jgi:hypothetical protein
MRSTYFALSTLPPIQMFGDHSLIEFTKMVCGRFPPKR